MTRRCSLCSCLPPSGAWRNEADAPREMARLAPAVSPPTAHRESLRRCPECSTYYACGVDDETSTGGQPARTLRLRRLHPLEALGRLEGDERGRLESRLGDIVTELEADLSGGDMAVRREAGQELAAFVEAGDARAIAAGRRRVARGGEALLAALMKRDRPWALAHFGEALTGLPAPGDPKDAVPNVGEWPRLDLPDLLKARSICLLGTSRGGRVSRGRTVFYADELFFHVYLPRPSAVATDPGPAAGGDEPQPLLDLSWLDKAEFADWVARQYDERVSAELIGRYSDIPPAVLAEAPRRARRVDVALGMLFGGSRWLALGGSQAFLRHSYRGEWHVVEASAETVIGVSAATIGSARRHVLDRLKDAAELVTEPTPPGIAAAVDAILGRAREAFEGLGALGVETESGLLVEVEGRYAAIQVRNRAVGRVEWMDPADVWARLVGDCAKGHDLRTVPLGADLVSQVRSGIEGA
jgi:hypothetical protein